MDETPMDPIKAGEREASKFLRRRINVYFRSYLFSYPCDISLATSVFVS